MRLPKLLLTLVFLAGAGCKETPSDYISRQPELYQEMLRASQDAPFYAGSLNQCPADILPESLQLHDDSEVCAAKPDWCQIQCRAGFGSACFGLARVVEQRLESTGRSNFSFPYYMAACRAGHPNGCANAGATAKNGNWLPETRPSKAASPNCQYRTYDMSCEAGATWGCFMLGLEWGFEGVDGKTDASKAKAAFNRSCNLQPDGTACEASQRRLELLSD